ncbi:MAG: hypothetical protein IJ313_02420 [Clostridia bacterium]|nr:hypothetical protein [Clostridia bacterium]
MKRAVIISQAILMAFLGMPVGCFFIGNAFDYDITLRMAWVYVWLTACSALAAGILARRTDAQTLRASTCIQLLVLPLALLYNLTLLFLAQSRQVVIPSVFVLVCAAYLFHKYTLRTILRTACKILSCLLLVLWLLILPFSFFPIGRTTIVQTLDSPDGRYQVQLIDIDEGALGGNTDVRVMDRNKSLDMGLISVEKCILVYRTGWGAFEDIQLHWENDETLYIDERAYVISEIQ